MNTLDLPLSVVLASWLLRRVSRRKARLLSMVPRAVLDEIRGAIGKTQEGLRLYNLTWVQRMCLYWQRAYISRQEALTAHLTGVDHVFFVRSKDD